MMLALYQKQRLFPKLLVKLLAKAWELGYEVSLGEVWRPPEMVQIYKSQGKGIKNSLHPARLALDLNLFKDGKYLDKTEHHRELGEYWESLSTEEYKCCWGGRFGDGNHYSIEHEGVK